MQSFFRAPPEGTRPGNFLPGKKLRLSLICPLCLALLLGAAVLTPAKPEVFDQNQVKAVFLYNLAHFITWPRTEGDAGAPLNIGVFGNDSLGTFLEQAVSGEKINGRHIVVKRFQSLEGIESDPSDMIFINGDQMASWPRIREIARRRKILTVSDAEGFGRRGGIIVLLTTGRRIRIEINLAESRRNGFQISSKLLNLSHIVIIEKDE